MNRRSFFAALGGSAVVSFASRSGQATELTCDKTWRDCLPRFGDMGNFKGFPCPPSGSPFVETLDPDIVAEHLTIEDGERLIINVMRRNGAA